MKEKILASAYPGAAIIVLNKTIEILALRKYFSKHVAVSRISRYNQLYNLQLVSAYFKYSLLTTHFVRCLKNVLENGNQTIIGTDGNGHSKLWHSEDMNQRANS